MLYFIRFFTGVVTVFLTAVSNAYASPLSAYDFMKPARNGDLVISPSGKYVAFSQTETGSYCLDKYGRTEARDKKCKDKNKVFRSVYQVVIYDLEEGKHIRILPTPENYYVGWLEFASDDRLLASIGTRTTVGKNRRAWARGASRILSFPVFPNQESKTEFIELFGDQKKVLRSNYRLSGVTNMLRDDPDHVLMPARKGVDLDLWKVNILTGEANRIAAGKSGTFFWYTSKKGKPLLRYDCVGLDYCHKVKVYAQNSGTGDWEKIRDIKIKEDETIRDSDFFPAALTDNENEIYIFSDEDDDTSERRTLKIYDLQKQAYTRTVYEHPTMDVGGVLTSNTTGDYMGVWLYEDRLTYKINDPVLQNHYNGLNKFFDHEANISVVGYNKNGDQALFYVSAHNSSGAYYLYNYAAKHVENLISRKPGIEDGLDSDGRIVKVPMRDGTTITGYHYYPKGQQSGRPLIVMPHGGPHLRDTFGFDSWVQYFVSQGYQVVQMNFRGSNGYGRVFEEAGYGEWGGLMMDDITDTTKFFHDNGLATSENTCIVGYSFGGYAALMAGATTPNLYKCIVSGGGVSDLNKLLKDDKDNLNEKSYERMKKTLALGDPKGAKNMLAAVSPVNFADNFQAPVLLIHGEWDGRVEIHHAEKMEKALKKAGKDVTYLELEEEGHNNWDLENDILYLETIKSFLDQHIGN